MALHEIEIRIRYVLQILHQILVLLLKVALTLNDECINKADLNIGLAEVISKNQHKFKSKKNIHDNEHYKKHFYDKRTGLSKTSIEIKELDISVLVILVKTNFISRSKTSVKSLLKEFGCCVDCLHQFCVCGINITNVRNHCPKKANCKYGDCKNSCPAVNCQLATINKFVDVARALRNSLSHITEDLCKKLALGNPVLEDFPLSNSWLDIWEIVNGLSLNCLEVLVKKKFITQNELEDQKMELWISLRKSSQFLLPVVGENLQHYHNVILGEQTATEKLEHLQLALENKNKELSMDYVYLDGRLFAFNEAKRKVGLNLKSISEDSLTFSSDLPVMHQESVLQCKFNVFSKWMNMPKDSFDLQTTSNLSVVLKNFDCGHSKISLRLLVLETNGNVVHFVQDNLDLSSFTSDRFVKSLGIMISSEVLVEGCYYQKTNCGLLIYNVPDEEVKVVQIKSVKDSEWKDVNTFKVIKDGSVLSIEGLECTTMDVRFVTSNNENNLFTSYTLNAVTVVDVNQLSYVTNHQNVLVNSHPFGVQTDVHHFLPEVHSLEPPVIQYHRGAGKVRKSLAEANDYLDTNFTPEEKIIRFPPKWNICDTPESVSHALADRFQEKFQETSSERRRILLPFNQCLSQQYLRDFGFSLCSEEYLMIFDGSLNLIILLAVSKATNEAGFHQDLQNLNLNMKAFVRVCSDLLTKDCTMGEPLAIVGAVCCPTIEERVLKKFQLWQVDNGAYYRNVITKRQFENQEEFNHWYFQLCANIHQELNGIRCISLDNLSHNFYQYANRMMMLLALQDVELPSVFGSTDIKIRSLLLNREQMEAVHLALVKKQVFITGPYGSGKTITSQKILENALPTLDPLKDVVYYVVFDQYSLLQVESEKYCQRLTERFGIKIQCFDINEVPSKRHITAYLSTCLQYLLTKVEDGQRLHVFVDEFDTEMLSNFEQSFLDRFVDQSLSQSFLVISTQSIRKYRSFKSPKVKAASLKISTRHFEKLKERITFIELGKIMRLSANILALNEMATQFIENVSNRYQEPSIHLAESPEKTVNQGEIPMLESQSSQQNSQQQSSLSLQTSDLDVVDSGVNDSNSNAAVFSDVEGSIDRILKQTQNKIDLTEERLILETEFKFYENSGCGHLIRGINPSLLRLPTGSNLALLASAILKVANPFWKRSLFVCNDLESAAKVFEASLLLGLDVIPYFGGLTFTTVDCLEKQWIYNTWITSKNCVLLTDNRGCRGLQNEHVVLFLDEEESWEHYLLPEMIGRATSNLSIITFNHQNTNKLNSSFDQNKVSVRQMVETFSQNMDTFDHQQLKELKVWRKMEPNSEKLLAKLKDHNLTKDIKLKAMEAWNGIANKQALLNSVGGAPVDRKNIDSFLRARYLTAYIVNKHFADTRSERFEKFPLGDKLYEKAIQMYDTIKMEDADLYNKLKGLIRESKDIVGFYRSIITTHILQLLHIGRIGIVFVTLLICCEYFKENMKNDHIERLIEVNACVLSHYQDWIEDNIFHNKVDVTDGEGSSTVFTASALAGILLGAIYMLK